MAEQTGIWYHGAKWEVVEGTRGVVFDPHGAVLEFRDRDWAHDNGLDKRVVAVWNALAGVEDPAAGLRGGREALEGAIVELQEWAVGAARGSKLSIAVPFNDTPATAGVGFSLAYKSCR